MERTDWKIDEVEKSAIRLKNYENNMDKEQRFNLGKEISALLHKAVELEADKWKTAISYNVDNETLNKIINTKNKH